MGAHCRPVRLFLDTKPSCFLSSVMIHRNSPITWSLKSGHGQPWSHNAAQCVTKHDHDSVAWPLHLSEQHAVPAEIRRPSRQGQTDACVLELLPMSLTDTSEAYLRSPHGRSVVARPSACLLDSMQGGMPCISHDFRHRRMEGHHSVISLA